MAFDENALYLRNREAEGISDELTILLPVASGGGPSGFTEPGGPFYFPRK
jgi:hypothetical protein